MSERTYKIADAILDGSIEEYREFNLASADAVSDYAENGMGILISDDEAEVILKACKEYLAIVEGEGFDGQGQLAWDRTIGALYDYEEN